MPIKKVLQHRVLRVRFDVSPIPLSIKIARDNKIREYFPTYSSITRLTILLNQPGITGDVDLHAGMMDYYFLRNIEVEEPELPEAHEEKVEINGETHKIPY